MIIAVYHYFTVLIFAWLVFDEDANQPSDKGKTMEVKMKEIKKEIKSN